MRILEDLAAEARQCFSDPRGYPVAPAIVPDEVRRYLAERYDFSSPVAIEKVFRDVSEMFHRWNVPVTHPRHFGPSSSNVDASAVVAEALAALYDPPLAEGELSAAGREIERFTLARVAEAFGYDADRTFSRFTGGRIETLRTVLTTALAHRFPRFQDEGLAGLGARPVMYVSQEGDPAFAQAARACGLGRHAVRFVPVKDDFRMDGNALALRIDEDLDRGFVPFLVVATAGTSNTGAVDGLSDLAQLCRDRGLWLHAEAAGAAAAAFSERLRPLLAGVERADSITCDARKWLAVPEGAGLFLCRRPLEAEAEWGSRANGLKVFMTLAELGLPCLAWRLEHRVRIGDYLRERLSARGFRPLHPSPLPVVCFTHPRIEVGEVEAGQLAAAVAESQVGWISEVRLRGEVPALRASIQNFQTQEGDVDVLVEGLDRALIEAAVPAVARAA